MHPSAASAATPAPTPSPDPAPTARKFGTFGVDLGRDLFGGGRRGAAIGEHKAQLNQAEENLARVNEEVELRVQAAFNKLERTRQMVKVSDELVALRTESRGSPRSSFRKTPRCVHRPKRPRRTSSKRKPCCCNRSSIPFRLAMK